MAQFSSSGNPSSAYTFAAVTDHDAGESDHEVDTSPRHASPIASTLSRSP
jgi:hypothetical protein